jgi:hypothetical protein
MANLEFSDVVLRIVAEYTRQHVNTSVPARVIAVDNYGSDQTVDVLPTINDVFSDGTVLELPPILDVPIQFPSAGGGLLSFPVAVGDTVLLIFSKRSLDEWMSSRTTDKGTFTPADRRNYSLNDAIAIPGLYSKNTNLSPNTTDVELKFNNISFKLEKSGNASLTNGNGSNSVTLASSGDVTLVNSSGSITIASSGLITLANAGGSIALNLDGSVAFGNGAAITAAGDMVTATGKSMSNHTHPQGIDSDGNTQQNTGSPV